ncbi:MAG: NERD domain-containing protein [Gammaproteobacteria bacterium]|nr:NERD domain-containing protein [Gammaproteobacteria bacterium]
MTIVSGKIEPLKALRKIFSENGVSRFDSIGDINKFLSSYQSEFDDLPRIGMNQLDSRIAVLERALKETEEKRAKSFLSRVIYYFRSRSFSKQLSDYQLNYQTKLEQTISRLKKELDATKSLVDSLYSTIAGAIGETKVVKEIEKLPDTFYLINDFYIHFNPPIYNKLQEQRIYSIQVDHVVVSRAGVFLLETKNWSQKSIADYDLRSPVEQVKRTSFGLFVLLNGDSNVELADHHWGDKKVPLRNIIVMTNAKPKEEFKYVKVSSLSDLIGYITYFDEIFSDEEVKSIFNYLNTINEAA